MKQQGDITVIAVVVLALLLAIWQGSSELLLQHRIQQLHTLRGYLQARLGAISALHWGAQQNWPQDQEQCCLTQENDRLQSCFYRLSPQQGVLSGQRLGAPYSLWQRVWISPAEPSKLQPMSSGWSDICPLPALKLCQVS